MCLFIITIDNFGDGCLRLQNRVYELLYCRTWEVKSVLCTIIYPLQRYDDPNDFFPPLNLNCAVNCLISYYSVNVQSRSQLTICPHVLKIVFICKHSGQCRIYWRFGRSSLHPTANNFNVTLLYIAACCELVFHFFPFCQGAWSLLL